jgi:Na+-transporting methylmalonyl-CoA/oxaloacetate decarboxylase gamma subunit
MAENINIAVQITLIGMGLVFGAIILLWIIMGLIVKLTTEKEKPSDILSTSAIEYKKLCAKAACAAVAIAISYEDEPIPHEFPLPATALVSAWQAVMRTDMLKKRGRTR